MPNVPKWVADQMENLLSSRFLDVEVKETIQYSRDLKKITFATDLKNTGYYPGSSMVFRAGDRELRHYTPYAFNTAAGTFEVIFHIHGNGPGSHLADRLLPGDRLKVSAPGGKKLYHGESGCHYFFGDETSLSCYLALVEEVNKDGQLIDGIFELNEHNLDIPEGLGCEVKTFLRSPDQAAFEAIAFLRADIAARPELLEDTVFYLTGNVVSVQAIRKELRSLGVASKNIKLQGYWSEGSIGL